MKTQVIVPAAGMGTRLKSDVIKPLISLHDKPLLSHTLSVFEKCDLVDSVILVVSAENMTVFADLVRKEKFRKVIHIVPGGETRALSVVQGLAVLDNDTDYVAVHDGARPLILETIVENALTQCFKEGAVIVAVPLKPTIKRINPNDFTVEETLDRRILWEVQTPQVFKKEILLQAYKDLQNIHATDDSALVEKLGIKVKLVRGDYNNIKITTPEDIVIAEAILLERLKNTKDIQKNQI